MKILYENSLIEVGDIEMVLSRQTSTYTLRQTYIFNKMEYLKHE